MGSLGIISDKLPPTAPLPAAPGTSRIGIGSGAAVAAETGAWVCIGWLTAGMDD